MISGIGVNVTLECTIQTYSSVIHFTNTGCNILFTIMNCSFENLIGGRGGGGGVETVLKSYSYHLILQYYKNSQLKIQGRRRQRKSHSKSEFAFFKARSICHV